MLWQGRQDNPSPQLQHRLDAELSRLARSAASRSRASALMDSAGRGYNLTGQGQAERIAGTPRHRELLRRARRPADDGPHVPEGRGRRRPRSRRRPQPRVVDAPLRRRSRDRRQDHPDRRQGARRRRRDARVVRLRIRHPPRAVGAGRLDGGRSRAARRNSFIAHRPAEARRHVRAGGQRDGHDRPRAGGGVPARERGSDRARRADERIRHAAEARRCCGRCWRWWDSCC